MDPEVKAMAAITDALDPLDEQARERVVRWAAGRFGVQLSGTKARAEGQRQHEEAEAGDSAGTGEHETLAELFAAANPTTGYLRALVAAYWVQEVQGNADFTSFEVNKELKNLGHGSKRINSDFDDLMKPKPQLAVQLKKAGKSQQARKRYKITQAGITRVQEMISGGTGE